MKIKELYQLFLNAEHEISTDSRKKTSGALFFALKGNNFNGNKFACTALENGCAYAIIDEAAFAVSEQYILVDDVTLTLQALACHHRLQMDIPLIAITGTNGKTTTKELTACVLKQKYNLLYTEGNFNNHIGVPLTLLRLRKEHEMALIEMGANHLGEIRILSQIACPTSGLITNVGKAHLEGFSSLEGVIAAKTELYKYLRLHDGSIFANESNQYLKHELINDEYIKYGIDSKNLDICGHIESSSPYLSISWKSRENEPQHLETKLIGAYNAENILAAITIGKHYGVSIEKINNAIQEYTPTNNRSQLKKTEKNTIIIDAYNANPTSMSTALNSFSSMEYINKYVILGDMLELGDQSNTEHINIVHLLKKLNLGTVILVGEEFSKIKSTYTTFENCAALNAWFTKHPIEDKFILLKGSHGIGLEKCIDLL